MRKMIRGAVKCTVAWVKRHRRRLKIAGGIVLAISILGQLLMPSTVALPFTSVVGQRIDFKSREEIVKIIQGQFTEADIKLVAGKKHYTEQLSMFGASINPDSMASSVLDYPLILRFLPLSVLWYHPQVDRFAIEFEDAQLSEVAKEAHGQLTTEPRDASLSIKNGKLTVETAADGRLVSVDEVISSVKQTTYYAGANQVTIDGERTTPRVSDQAIATVKKQAEDMLSREVIISIDGSQDFKPSREEVASWITIETGKKQAVSMTLSTDKISSYLESINSKVGVKPTVTTVSLLDGKERRRDKGKVGLAVPAKKSADKIRERLMTTQDDIITISLSREEVASPMKYKRSYSSTQAGLTAYVKYTTSDNDIKIAVHQLGGDGLFSNGKATDSVPAASTYKLYVMQRVFDDIKSGKRKWEDKIVGNSLSTCFERMIVVSANKCSEELIKQFGAQKLTDYLRDQGYSTGTDLNHADAAHTTAADLLKLLVGVENGSAIRGQNREMLLEKMSRQVHRNGIPAGSNGKVYDKVGFLWDYNHDAAIVRHPKGTYALVVLTKGHSFDKVAEITRQIEGIMYP